MIYSLGLKADQDLEIQEEEKWLEIREEETQNVEMSQKLLEKVTWRLL